MSIIKECSDLQLHTHLFCYQLLSPPPLPCANQDELCTFNWVFPAIHDKKTCNYSFLKGFWEEILDTEVWIDQTCGL